MTGQWGPIVYVAVGIATTSLAQIGLKLGSAFDVLSVRWLAYLFGSATTYLISFVCYYLALRHYDVSKISPIMMVGTMLIITLFGFFTGERVTPTRMFGVALAVSCIIVMAKS